MYHVDQVHYGMRNGSRDIRIYIHSPRGSRVLYVFAWIVLVSVPDPCNQPQHGSLHVLDKRSGIETRIVHETCDIACFVHSYAILMALSRPTKDRFGHILASAKMTNLARFAMKRFRGMDLQHCKPT